MAAPYRKKPTRDLSEEDGIGGIVKAKYDGMLGRIGTRLWNGAKQVIDSNFGMGMLLTAVGIVATMAIMGGWMSSVGTLTVGHGAAFPETGAGSGIGHALSFLSPIDPKGFINYAGMGTLIAGGLAGRYLLPKLFSPSPAMDAKAAQAKAEALGLGRAVEPAITPEQNQGQSQEQGTASPTVAQVTPPPSWVARTQPQTQQNLVAR